MDQIDIGMRGVAAVLPETRCDLPDLAARGLLVSPPDVLADLGFTHAHVLAGQCSPLDVARAAACEALQDAAVDPADIDLLVWASARPDGHALPARSTSPSVFDGFTYPSAWLQHELGLDAADVLAVAQQGCSTMFAALRAARAILLSEPERRHALCVGVDALPAGATRELLYTVVSDAACAVVLSRASSSDRWVGYHQVSRGSSWNPAAAQHEILASYFPIAARVIGGLLERHRLDPAAIDVVIPTGVSADSWRILLDLTGIPFDRLYTGAPPFGHTISADSFVHLQHLRRTGRVAAGAKVLLFTYGFGSSWCALLLEH